MDLSNSDLSAVLEPSVKKSVHPDPYKRYESLSEFIADLRTPNSKFVSDAHIPLAERNPVAMWQILSLVLGLGIVLLITKLFSY